MQRPTRFAEHRYVGDRRTQLAYDVDAADDELAPVVAEIVESGWGTCFAPDTEAELRNRGYRLVRA